MSVTITFGPKGIVKLSGRNAEECLAAFNRVQNLRLVEPAPTATEVGPQTLAECYHEGGFSKMPGFSDTTPSHSRPEHVDRIVSIRLNRLESLFKAVVGDSLAFQGASTRKTKHAWACFLRSLEKYLGTNHDHTT